MPKIKKKILSWSIARKNDVLLRKKGHFFEWGFQVRLSGFGGAADRASGGHNSPGTQELNKVEILVVSSKDCNGH